MYDEFLNGLLSPSNRDWEVLHHEIIPEKPPRPAPIPDALHELVKERLRACGLQTLYSHQAEAVNLALDGKNVVVSTSTASGKTLAYQIPVLDKLLKDPTAHALFLFPLKALERDQRDSFLALVEGTGVTAAVYDGDTPDSQRRMIKQNPPRVIITNPDMLHVGFLAYHSSWRQFFARLRYVILDEVHTYKGIFGSHISQVLLRIKRVCALHGSRPQFMACSATVANPGSFVSTLTGEEVTVVSESGAPSQQRSFVFLNPILSLNTVAARLFVDGLELGLKTIVFARARKITELITTWVLQMAPDLRGRISSYRAGFLPEERRRIEAKLFAGEMDGVITTSALEMGIDVGGLDLCLLVGYPGTVVNTWQRGGRVGRAGRPSAIVLIAGTDALDQYFMRNPHDFFARSSEEAIMDPRNKEVLKRHIPCAAAESPIFPEEPWTRHAEVLEVIEELERDGTLFKAEKVGAWYSPKQRPQRDVDLRGIGKSFGIFLEPGNTLIGTSAGPRVYTECHKGAVYLHRTRQYEVTSLDLERASVMVRPARLNYYTRAIAEKDTKILGTPLRSREFPGFTVSEARLEVTERVTCYEKRRTSGQELVGMVDLDLPPVHFETIGIWITIPTVVKDRFRNANLSFMGGIHAMEHAAISVFPLFALCDRDDIGGIATPMHEQVCQPAVFIYDGHPGGVGLSHRAFDVIEELLTKTRSLVKQCPCDDGCPSCIHSPKCGSGNKPLDKQACLKVLTYLLDPDTLAKSDTRNTQRTPRIFPDLAEAREAQPHGPLPVTAVGFDLQVGMETAAKVPLASLGEKTKAKIIRRSKVVQDDDKEESARAEDQSTAAPTPSLEKQESQQPEPLSPSQTQGGGTSLEPEPPQQEPAPFPTPDRRKRMRKTQHQSPRRVVVFDLETQKLADEVGGWHNVAAMKISLGVAYTEGEGFRTFMESEVQELVSLLKSADLVVGYNQMRFDYQVLSAYTSENLRALPNLDILAVVEKILGFRLKLDTLAKHTLSAAKSGDGLDAVKWFREGRMNLVEEYCRQDVQITLDLYRFGKEKGYLVYRRGGRTASRIPVDWS